MMRYWQLTKENGREMLDRLNSYVKEGYIWLVVAHKEGGQIHDFTIVFHCDLSLSKEDNCSQWYIDKYGEKFQIGDYLVFKDANLFIASAEAIKELEEEDEEKVREKEATECEKKVLLEQLLEAYNKHEYTRSTILHNKLMKMGMTENEIMGEVNAMLCVKPKVEKEEIESDDCKDQIADQESLFDELFEACKNHDNHDYARREYLQNKLIRMGVSMKEIRAKINALIGAKSETKEVDIKTSSTPPIDELQKILVRRAQLQKELAEIEETLTQKYEIKVINTENK